MAANAAFQLNTTMRFTHRPIPTPTQLGNVPSRKIDSKVHVNEVSQKVQGGKGTQHHSWAQIAQGSNNLSRAHCWFQPQVAQVQGPNVSYPANHLLGIPQEIRDAILEVLSPAKEAVGARPVTGYQSFQLACRQTFQETSRRWNYQPMVLVPSNRTEEFIARTLDITILHSNAYHNVKSIFFEIRHDAPSSVFCQMAQVLRLSTQLEELHLFGIGPDGYGVNTSSVAHGCGKHDTSIMLTTGKLQIDGQQYHRRLTLVNSIPWLQSLRVLVLDNLNLPLLQAHVLKNKPRLEKLYIAADPRTVLHGEYKNQAGLGLGSLIFPVLEDAPPVKELHVGSNAIVTASGITARVASTLETLEWVIPDIYFQVHTKQVNFYAEADLLLRRLDIDARRLRELRVCVHGSVSEDHHDYGRFMGALKDCISRMHSIQLVEFHVHSKSPWFAAEFIEALPPSVSRLYLTDLFVERDTRGLCGFISAKTMTPLKYSGEINDAFAIGEDLCRKDFIRFSPNKLAFVGYEYDLLLQQKAAGLQDKDTSVFLKMNGRLLDKERNRHLARLEGKGIPFKEVTADECVEDFEPTMDELWSAATHEEVEENRRVLGECALSDNEDYFGNEEVAEIVFQNEPVAKGRHYSYPAILKVEDEFKFSNHWLSK